LRLPVLLVSGANDPAYAAHAHAMQKLMPAAEVLIVPKAGHLAHLENLPAFAAGFGSFLSRLPDAVRPG
jgi:pimeloyl-ACP methyl ester carboxylesterase